MIVHSLWARELDHRQLGAQRVQSWSYDTHPFPSWPPPRYGSRRKDPRRATPDESDDCCFTIRLALAVPLVYGEWDVRSLEGTVCCASLVSRTRPGLVVLSMGSDEDRSDGRRCDQAQLGAFWRTSAETI